MGFLFCIVRKNKSRLWISGGILNELSMATVTCKVVAERLSEEKGISLNEAIKFITDSIIEMHDLIK